MTKTVSTRKPVVDWITVVAIAAIAISLNVAIHEGTHALTCLLGGGDLQEYSALHVLCGSQTVLQDKFVAGSAAIFNILFGLLIWRFVSSPREMSSSTRFFLWLFMLMNWLNGSGYFMFSGFANVGDLAEVIDGWEPAWLWRVLMTIFGTVMFLFFVWLALRELGKMIGGELDEQIGRANKLGLISYFTAFLVVLLAGLFNPYGFASLPVIAGLLAVAGGLSPLVWMMQWFRAKNFVKVEKKPLEIHRSWQLIAVAGVAVFVYAFILGKTIYF